MLAESQGLPDGDRDISARRSRDGTLLFPANSSEQGMALVYQLLLWATRRSRR